MSKQVIGKKLKLMDVPAATGEVQQLVITPGGNVVKEPKKDSLLFAFMLPISAVDAHFHTLSITTAEFQHLLDSFENTIIKETSLELDSSFGVTNHSHQVTLKFNPYSNLFEVLSVTPGDNGEHIGQIITVNSPNLPANGQTVSLDIGGVMLVFEKGLLVESFGG
jgi:hypothetical protein